MVLSPLHAEPPRYPALRPSKATSEEDAIELLEGEARRRAYEGTVKPVYYKGEQCGKIREYSDTLMMFILKAKKPEYRDRLQQDINLNGAISLAGLVGNE